MKKTIFVYRKPTVHSAIQWDGKNTREALKLIRSGWPNCKTKVVMDSDLPNRSSIFIYPRPHSEIRCCLTDWIVLNGGVQLMSDEDFLETFSIAPGQKEAASGKEDVG